MITITGISDALSIHCNYICNKSFCQKLFLRTFEQITDMFKNIIHIYMLCQYSKHK